MTDVVVNGKPLTPGKILCIGRNYVAHIEELGNEVPDEMVVFMKPLTAISDTLRAELGGEALHFEGELAFTVAAGRLAAVGFGLDLTKRALQSSLKDKGLPWERAKAFDGAALFSDFVPVPDDLSQLSLQLWIDGELRQEGGVPLMMYPPETIIEELSRFTTLADGDIVMTGTPAGVGPVHSGQAFEGRVLSAGATLVSATWLAH